jgi:hypothetical protein
MAKDNVVEFDRELSELRLQNNSDKEFVQLRMAELRSGGVGPGTQSRLTLATPAPAPAMAVARAAAATAATASPVGADLKEAEARTRALEAVTNRYFRIKDQFFLKDAAQTLAFSDKGDKLHTKLNDPEIARSMVDLAVAKGWDVLKVAGSDEFKREVWLYASARNLDVAGYKPNELDKLKLSQLQRDVGKVVDQAQRQAPAHNQPKQQAGQAQAPAVSPSPIAAAPAPIISAGDTLRAIERRNEALLPIPKDALSQAEARQLLVQDVSDLKTLHDAEQRHQAAVVMGDNARIQQAYRAELSTMPDIAAQVAAATVVDERRMAAREDRKGATAEPQAAQQQALGLTGSDVPPPLTARHIAALTAMETIMRRSDHTDAQIEAALKHARQQWTNDRVYVGRVVEQGEAKYEFKPDGSPSYFVRMEDPHGGRFLLWGVDLPRALRDAGGQVGEDLVVSFRGAQKVDVPVTVDGENGRTTRYESVSRNSWHAVPVSALAPDAAARAIEKARQVQGPVQSIVTRLFQRQQPAQEIKAPAPQIARGR